MRSTEMRLDDVWTIARKDLMGAWTRKGIRNAIILFPLVAAVSLPRVIVFAHGRNRAMPASMLPALLQSFLFFFMIAVTTLPTAIAAYSLVGEKVERSLEPMLATPISVASVLVGKMIAAVVPTLLSVWTSCIVFMVLANRAVAPILGRGWFPQTETWVQLLVLMPLVALMTVNIDILVSARVGDVRSAQQIAGLTTLPFAAIYVAAEMGSVTLDTTTLLRMAVLVAMVAAGTLAIARRTFDREEILTRWS